MDSIQIPFFPLLTPTEERCKEVSDTTVYFRKRVGGLGPKIIENQLQEEQLAVERRMLLLMDSLTNKEGNLVRVLARGWGNSELD